MSQKEAAEIISLAATRKSAPAAIGDENAGVFLMYIRESAGLSLDEVSEAIKVKASHLQSIEETRSDLLPAAPYAIGFVKVYAQFLGLDVEAVVQRFKEDVKATAPLSPEPVKQETSFQDRPAAGEGVRMASVFGIIAVLIFAVWITVQIAGGDKTARQDSSQEAVASVRLTDIPAPKPTLTPAITTPVPERSEGAKISTGDGAPSPDDASPEAAPVNTPPPLRDPVVVPATPANAASPDYPMQCDQGAAILESVTVLFDVSAAGRPQNIRVVSSTNACFESEATQTIAKWRFNPRTVDGTARADLGKKATINFRR